MRSRSHIGLILVVLSALAPALGAAEPVTFQQVAKLTGTDTVAGDFFGQSVALIGDRLIVGAQWDDDRGDASGSAYVFERDAGGSGEWREVAKLLAPDGLADDWLGAAVALSGETVVVGASVDDQERLGYAYVFARDVDGSWRAVAKLQAEDGMADDSFGSSAAISGDTAVVGAGFADGPGGSYDGAVYVFERDAGGPGNWGQTAKLTAAKACDVFSDGTSCGWIFDDGFGASVAVSGDVLMVGGSAGLGSGHVYAFRRLGDGPDSRWQGFTRIQPAETQSWDGIGGATAISGGTLLLGARGDDDKGGQAGALYVYEADPGAPTGVRRTAKLYAPDAEGIDGDWFGDAVALSGDTAVVGAPQKERGGSGYIFRREEGASRGWIAMTKLLPAELASGDSFGDTVAISGDTAVVGAWGDDDRGTQAGAVYVFQETTAQADSRP